MKELDHFMNKDVYTDPELAFRTDYPYVEASGDLRLRAPSTACSSSTTATAA